MNTLFQVNTLYQLMIVINMRYNGMPYNNADLIITDHTPALRDMIQKIKETKLFGKVYYVESLVFNNYFWSIENKDKPLSFYQAEIELNKIVKSDISIYKNYEELYVANLDAYTKFIYSIYPKLKISLFEDGAGTCTSDWKMITAKWDYIKGFNRIYYDLEKIYMYTPELLQYDLGHDVTKLPPINGADKKLVEILNTAFDYDINFNLPKFVFAEEPFQIDNISNNDIEIIEKISEIVGYNNLFIKTHPRNTINRTKELGLGKQAETPWPFELILLNNENSDNVFLTVTSGSLISARAVLGISPTTVFLYNVIKGQTHNHGEKEFKDFLDAYFLMYKDKNLVAPKSMRELEILLKLLK